MSDDLTRFTERMEAFTQFSFGSMLSVAPEKEAELRASMKQHGISLEIVRTGAFFQVIPHDEPASEVKWRVQTTAVACYYLWAFVNYHNRLIRAIGARAMGEHSTDERVEVAAAQAALEWAVTAVQRTDAGESLTSLPTIYPELAPYPPPDGADANPAYWSSEIGLVAIGWIMQHELVHAQEQHQALTKAEARSNEIMADRGAADWILDMTVANETMIVKRSLGIICAVLSLVELECRFPPPASGSHPEATERLMNAAGNGGMHQTALDVGAVIMLEMAARFGFASDSPSGGGFDAIAELALALRSKQRAQS